MPFNPDIDHRRSIRLRGYDYSQNGFYFTTICINGRDCILGKITDGKMILNEIGRIACDVWSGLPGHYNNLKLDEYVFMPNHIHGIIQIVGAGLKPDQKQSICLVGAGFKPAPTVKQHGLPEMIRGFKTFSARRINEFRNDPGCCVWQRNYYERVIRNEQELFRARQYIVNNPLKWELDNDNPINFRPNS